MPNIYVGCIGSAFGDEEFNARGAIVAIAFYFSSLRFKCNIVSYIHPTVRLRSFRSLKNHIPKLGMDPIADNTAKSNEKRGEMKVYSIPSAPATS